MMAVIVIVQGLKHSTNPLLRFPGMYADRRGKQQCCPSLVQLSYNSEPESALLPFLCR